MGKQFLLVLRDFFLECSRHSVKPKKRNTVVPWTIVMDVVILHKPLEQLKLMQPVLGKVIDGVEITLSDVPPRTCRNKHDQVVFPIEQSDRHQYAHREATKEVEEIKRPISGLLIFSAGSRIASRVFNHVMDPMRKDEMIPKITLMANQTMPSVAGTFYDEDAHSRIEQIPCKSRHYGKEHNVPPPRQSYHEKISVKTTFFKMPYFCLTSRVLHPSSV